MLWDGKLIDRKSSKINAKKIKKYNCNLVEVTGGEPLLQSKCIELLNKLVEIDYDVMLETGGSLPINLVPKNVKKIILH